MKLIYYIFMITGIVILLNAGGYVTPSGGAVKTLILDTDPPGDDVEWNQSKVEEGNKLKDIKSSTWYIGILAAFALVATAGIVIGTLTNTVPISYVIAGGLSLFMGLYIIDLISIYIKLLEHTSLWMTFLATIIFAPLTIGFIITALEWWQGVD